VVDLPADERPELRRVQLVAPTSTDERLRTAAETTDGWLYLVSVTGTTGARAELAPSLAPLAERARRRRARRRDRSRHACGGDGRGGRGEPRGVRGVAARGARRSLGGRAKGRDPGATRVGLALEQLEHLLDDLRVELAAGAAPQLLDDGGQRQRRPVRPVGRHCVERVGAADDPRDQRDVLAGEAVRIAGAVPALVARADDPADVGEEAADRGQEGLSVERVPL